MSNCNTLSKCSKNVIVTKENADTFRYTPTETAAAAAANEYRGKNKSIFRISINLMVIKSHNQNIKIEFVFFCNYFFLLRFISIHFSSVLWIFRDRFDSLFFFQLILLLFRPRVSSASCYTTCVYRLLCCAVLLVSLCVCTYPNCTIWVCEFVFVLHFML